MISLFLVIPVWVINCVLFFSPSSSLPTTFEFNFLCCFILWLLLLFWILSGLSDAVAVSWLVNYQRVVVVVVVFLMLRLSWLMLHLWWVLFLFCFVLQIWDCCAEMRILGVFLIFLKSQQLFYQSYRSVTQSKKMIQQCIFFTDIYLLFICMYVYVFYVYCFFCGGQTGHKVEELSVIGILPLCTESRVL